MCGPSDMPRSPAGAALRRAEVPQRLCLEAVSDRDRAPRARALRRAAAPRWRTPSIDQPNAPMRASSEPSSNPIDARYDSSRWVNLRSVSSASPRSIWRRATLPSCTRSWIAGPIAMGRSSRRIPNGNEERWKSPRRHVEIALGMFEAAPRRVHRRGAPLGVLTRHPVVDRVLELAHLVGGHVADERRPLLHGALVVLDDHVCAAPASAAGVVVEATPELVDVLGAGLLDRRLRGVLGTVRAHLGYEDQHDEADRCDQQSGRCEVAHELRDGEHRRQTDPHGCDEDAREPQALGSLVRLLCGDVGLLDPLQQAWGRSAVMRASSA